jgi:hypothetical protein
MRAANICRWQAEQQQRQRQRIVWLLLSVAVCLIFHEARTAHTASSIKVIITQLARSLSLFVIYALYGPHIEKVLSPNAARSLPGWLARQTFGKVEITAFLLRRDIMAVVFYPPRRKTSNNDSFKKRNK